MVESLTRRDLLKRSTIPLIIPFIPGNTHPNRAAAASAEVSDNPELNQLTLKILVIPGFGGNGMFSAALAQGINEKYSGSNIKVKEIDCTKVRMQIEKWPEIIEKEATNHSGQIMLVTYSAGSLAALNYIEHKGAKHEHDG